MKKICLQKINEPQKFKFVLGRVENFEGKGQNAGQRVVKSRDCMIKR